MVFNYVMYKFEIGFIEQCKNKIFSNKFQILNMTFIK